VRITLLNFEQWFALTSHVIGTTGPLFYLTYYVLSERRVSKIVLKIESVILIQFYGYRCLRYVCLSSVSGQYFQIVSCYTVHAEHVLHVLKRNTHQ